MATRMMSTGSQAAAEGRATATGASRPVLSSVVSTNRRRARTWSLTIASLHGNARQQAEAAARSAARRVCLLAGAVTLAASPASGMDIQMVDPDVFKIRDEVARDSYKKVDFAEMHRKQMENLSKRGTDEYDDECKVEESCLEKPKNLGEAVNRMFEIMNDSEMGMSSSTKLKKMGMNPEERVNSGAYYAKDE